VPRKTPGPRDNIRPSLRKGHKGGVEGSGAQLKTAGEVFNPLVKRGKGLQLGIATVDWGHRSPHVYVRSEEKKKKRSTSEKIFGGRKAVLRKREGGEKQNLSNRLQKGAAPLTGFIQK